MTLKGTINKVIATADKLTSSGKGNNEANTKALLIEPMLAELGWDVGDLDAVVREYKVFDNTFLDYALLIDGSLRLFIEAKAVAKNLDDKQFIAQTVNYANNEGVIWCVLTNNLTYRVYKTNEPVAMEKKLLFEVTLSEGLGAEDKAMDEGLGLISRAGLAGGRLDLFGERVFNDTRVRQALADLAAKPVPGFLTAIEKQMGLPQILPEQLRESLARVLDAAQAQKPVKGGHHPPVVTAKAKGGKNYSLEHHTHAIPTAIVDLLNGLMSSLVGSDQM